MVPLAVGGTSAIGVVVAGALLLIWFLLRMESREATEEEARERGERERQ